MRRMLGTYAKVDPRTMGKARPLTRREVAITLLARRPLLRPSWLTPCPR